VFSWIIGWKEKLIGIGIAVALFMGWVFKIKRDAEKKGAQKVTDAINKETKRTKDEWQKIDDTPLGVDDALRGLRQRASREDGNA
jgi:pyruvate/2-oxoglutarate dehydrogenase complex dihydrolipoamide acyltransferase (E2) component